MNKLFSAFLAGVFVAILWMGYAIVKDGGATERKYLEAIEDLKSNQEYIEILRNQVNQLNYLLKNEKRNRRMSF